MAGMKFLLCFSLLLLVSGNTNNGANQVNKGKFPVYGQNALDHVFNEYVIVLKKSSLPSWSLLLAEKLARFLRHLGGVKIKREFRVKNFIALHVHMSEKVVDILQERTEIDFIEVNQRFHLSQASMPGAPEPPVKNASTICYQQNTGSDLWGLSRIALRSLPSSYSFTSYGYGDQEQGEDVDVYVADTGINTAHSDLEGRAVWGMTAGGAMMQEPNDDLQGHGTHVAGIIGGKTYGVAKKTNLIAVKVLDKTGVGTMADVLEGVQWIHEQYNSKKQSQAKVPKAIVNLSLGVKGQAVALEAAILEAIQDGIHFVIAAGNNAEDGCSFSPGRISEAITVAATDINDKMATFSNFGPCVNVLAPGVDILSTYKGSSTATALMQGTSMASPFVTGVVARFLSRQSKEVSPSVVRAWITDSATLDAVLLDQAKGQTGTPNRLLHVDCISTGVLYVSSNGVNVPTPFVLFTLVVASILQLIY